MNTAIDPIPFAPAAPAVIVIRRSYWHGVCRQLARDPVAVGSALLLILIVMAAVFAPWLAPADPYKASMIRRLLPIGSTGYPLGTDELGRDLLTRLMYGGRLSLLMGVLPVLFAFVAGTSIGLVAGYLGGWVNMVIMRTLDVFYAFPSVLLAVAIAGALGPGMSNSLIALTLVFVPQIVRVAESVTTQVRQLDYVDAARLSGARRVLDHPRARARQCARAGVRLCHRAGQRQHDPRLGPVVPRAGREAARSGMGPDAQHAAFRDLCKPLDRRAAGHDDLRDLDGL